MKMAQEAIRVLIADDHPIVREGVKFTIEKSANNIRVVAEAGDGNEALELASATPADVFILDITMPGLNGLEATRRLVRLRPGAKVIILSLHDSRAFVEEALAAGARGYLLKETAARDLVEAIRQVHRGRCFLSPGIAHHLVDPLRRPGARRSAPGHADLTSREREVLQLIAEGLTGKEIAARLRLALNTVHVHRRNLMARLGLHKETELVRYALREGLAKA